MFNISLIVATLKAAELVKFLNDRTTDGAIVEIRPLGSANLARVTTRDRDEAKLVRSNASRWTP